MSEAKKVAVYFDPPTHHQFGDKLFDRESNPYAGDDILAPYVAVKERLVQAGLRVHTADKLPPRPDGYRNLVISFGTPDRLPSHTVKKYLTWAGRADVTLSAFFAMECPIVEPGLFRSMPRLQNYFRRMYSWSDQDALRIFTRGSVKLKHFCWPQSFDAVNEEIWKRGDRKFLLMMNANKLPRLYIDELYTERLRVVEFFNRYGEIDLYGRNWDSAPTRVGKTRTPYAIRRWESRLWGVKQQYFPDALYVAAKKAWRGASKSKSATLSEYRFAICFENSVLKGWMTEKLFDCFFAGTVPVYWGAPDVLSYVPAECFIDMREFKGYRELREHLKQLSDAEVQGYRTAARDYLASQRFDPFRIRTWVDRMASIVSEDAGIRV